jgi:hypothetical protein
MRYITGTATATAAAAARFSASSNFRRIAASRRCSPSRETSPPDRMRGGWRGISVSAALGCRSSTSRVWRLEEDIHEIKAALVRLEPLINRIDATLQHCHLWKAELATGLVELRTALADKPGRGYLWGVMGAMVGAQAVALAAAALIFSIIQMRPTPPGPRATAASIVLAAEAFDWDSYHERQNACAEKDRIATRCAQGGAFCD